MRDTKRAILFILPTYLVITIFIILPIFFALYISFNKWNLLAPMKFIGLSNYGKLFRSEEFWKALINTVYYTFITVPLCVIFALVIALLLNTRIKGIAFYRVAYFMPVMTSFVAVHSSCSGFSSLRTVS